MPGLILMSRAIFLFAISFAPLNVAPASTYTRIRFDVRAQPLPSAINAVGTLARMNILVGTNLVQSLQSPLLKGRLSVDDAFKRLLAGTQLRAVRVNETSICILTAADAERVQSAYASYTDANYQVYGANPTRSADQLRSVDGDTSKSSDAVDDSEGTPDNPSQRSANEASAFTQNPDVRSTAKREASGGAFADTNQQHLPEVLVTAQKRSERLQDVPVPVTALDANALAAADQSRLQDYFASVPGLNLNQSGGGGGGQQSLSIRGVTTGPLTNPTVGVAIDDVPYGSSSFLGFGSLLYPDIDPSDLERIEVLRGPQGTLYGASSIGGLIKFVTKDPSTGAFGGHVQLLGDHVENGEFGYGARGMVNVPLSGTLGIRLSGFARRDPGYVDNVITSQSDVNRVDVHGGRFTALWSPFDNLSVKVGALLQDTHGYGISAVDTNAFRPAYGDLKQARMADTEGFHSSVRQYTGTLTLHSAGLDFVSLTGYGTSNYSQVGDDTLAIGSLAQFGIPGTGFDGFGVEGGSVGIRYQTKKFSQEFRLSSADKQRLEWMVGAFYTHESSGGDVALIANELATGSPVGVIIDFNDPTTLSEYALFGDLTMRLTDQFDVQIGGRESKDRQVYDETDSGPATPAFYGSPSPFVNPTERTDGNAFTYLVTPRFKISQELMLYARFTSGYRVGGNNVNAVVGGVPVAYAPDKTNNYEIGLKGEAFHRALTFDASLYYIKWNNLQIQLFNPATFSVYSANGGNAKSQGLELSLNARPSSGLTITGAMSFNDAKLTQDLPSTSTAYGLAGDRLPFSSRFSASVSADQSFPLTSRWVGFVAGSFAYVGSREAEFTGSASEPRLRYPAYRDLDLRTGARDGSWIVSAFVNNVANKRGIIGGSDLPVQPGSNDIALYIQPRTVGISISKDF